jgi:hypothetical protein
MLAPLYIAGLIRAELQRARSMAAAVARNIGQVLDNADHAVPFALSRFDDLLADDIIRLLGCLQGAHELQDRLSEGQVTVLALHSDGPAPDAAEAARTSALATPVPLVPLFDTSAPGAPVAA